VQSWARSGRHGAKSSDDAHHHDLVLAITTICRI